MKYWPERLYITYTAKELCNALRGTPMKKSPIETVSRFYEVAKKDLCCPICQLHDYVIVQKLVVREAQTPYYAIHTYLSPIVSPEYCIHTWRTREEDPTCLKGLQPTDHIGKTAPFTALYGALLQRPAAQRDAAARGNIARIRRETVARLEPQDRPIEFVPMDLPRRLDLPRRVNRHIVVNNAFVEVDR